MHLSILMPGIRKHLWKDVLDSISFSIGNYSYELIIIGPYIPDQKLLDLGVIYMEDFGAPARCIHKGTTKANGKYITWMSDDGIYRPGELALCLDVMEEHDKKTQLIVKYTEGPGRKGLYNGDTYWKPRNHAAAQLPGVKESYWSAPVGMMHLSYFKSIGGFDCRYEHVNMCCHDLSFRIQNDDGKVILSPNVVFDCDWTPHTEEYQPVQKAFEENDLPLFQETYSKLREDRIKIPYDNWKESPEKWGRRFGDKDET